MSSPYQKVQPHFPEMSMKEVEALIGNTWDYHCKRDTTGSDSSLFCAYLLDMAGSPECLRWSEEKWLAEIKKFQSSSLEVAR